MSGCSCFFFSILYYTFIIVWLFANTDSNYITYHYIANPTNPIPPHTSQGEIDLNGDGVISYDEFKAMMQGLNSHSAKYRALMNPGSADAKDTDSASKPGAKKSSSQAKNFFSRSKK